MNYCQSCGYKLQSAKIKFCPECGKSINKNSSSLKKWIIALTISFSLCSLLFMMVISVLVFEDQNTTAQEPMLQKTKTASEPQPATKQESNNTPLKLKSLINSNFEFVCKMPQTWQTTEKKNMLIMHGLKNTDSEQANIVIQRFFYSPQQQYTLKDLGDSVINTCSSYPDYKIIEDTATTTSRKTVVEFYNTDKNAMYKYEQVLLKNKGRIYAVAFVVPSNIYDLYHDVMVTVVTTFKFI